MFGAGRCIALLHRYEGRSRFGLGCVGVKLKVLPAVWELGHSGGGVFDMLTDAVRDQVGESGRVCEDAGQVFKC
ncbi:hypothetical protein P910_003062 [Xylella fastidiosa Mul-MD]|nr:hypothetical protein P303_11980 [Xylella fastidiosa MUL0034]EWG13661.1 hypothetical protein P910_003062 [Xylella fastidiosa Mul-MD]